MNKLYFGDNLEILRELDAQRVHLICTDPPFNSGRDYNAFIGDSLAEKKHLPIRGYRTPLPKTLVPTLSTAPTPAIPTKHSTTASNATT